MANTTDLQRLVVSMEARYASMERELRKASGVANKQARAIETRFQKMNTSVGTSLGRLGGLLAGGLSLRAAQQLIDASTRIENSLKVAGLEGERLSTVYDELFASAQRNAAPIEALVELFSRASLVQKELGVSTEEMLQFTDRVAVALRVSGKSAEESSGALIQLSQALGSGTVRAEEFNAILEGALPIAQAAAAGIREAGGSVAKLRALVVDGKVSSQAFFRAFEAGAAILDEKVAGAELTVSQGFVRLQNVLIDAAGRFNETTGASQYLASALDGVAAAIERFGNFIPDAVSGIHDVRLAIHNWLVEMTGIGEHFDDVQAMEDAFLGTTQEIRNAAAATEVLRQKLAELGTAGGAASVVPAGGKVVPRTPELDARFGDAFSAVRPISIDDYVPPEEDKAGAKAVAAIGKVEDALRFEAEQLGRTAREQAIYNELNRAGVDINSEAGQRIAYAAGRLYDQEQAMDAAKEAAERLNDAVEQFGGDAFDAFLDVANGATTAKDAIKDLIKQLLIAQARSLFLNALGVGGGGGPISTILGGLFGGARANGGPVSPGRSYLVGERGPELLVPRVPGTVIPGAALRERAPTSSRSVSVGQVIIQTPDPASFRRSEAQVSAALGRAMRRSTRFA